METSLDQLNKFSAIDLRRWYVENVLLSVDKSQRLAEIEPPESLKALARGASPSHEHTGIAARLVYNMPTGAHWLLDNLPTFLDIDSWADPDRVAQIILAYCQPWHSWRFDPNTETVALALPTGHWAFRLKGYDSEIEIANAVNDYIVLIMRHGFDNVARWLINTGLIETIDPANHPDMEADEVVNAVLGNCRKRFNKFLPTGPAKKAIAQALMRHPLMRFDRSTVNTVTGFATFSNGVVPINDVYEIDESGNEITTYPAGILIEPDKEFVLSSVTGVQWPNDERWQTLMNYRAQIRAFLTDDTWDDWMGVALQYADQTLNGKAKTYKAFLDHAFPNSQDEPPIERDAFLRLLGAIVFGSNLKMVAALIGETNTGKDTVIGWLKYLLGSSKIGELSQSHMTASSIADDQRAFAPLEGKKVAVISGEVGDGRGSALSAEKIKSITSGGSSFLVAEKYAKPISIWFDGALIVQGNSVPAISGGDDALYETRLIAVEFKHKFPTTGNNADFERRYTREAPDFLKVLFIHYLDYVARGRGKAGVNPPESWAKFGKQLQTSADALSVIDRCLTSPDPTKSISIPASVFYKALNILARDFLGLRNDLSTVKWATRLKRAGVDYSTSSNPFRSKAKGGPWEFHFTLNADFSDGAFSQSDWDSALQKAAMAVS